MPPPELRTWLAADPFHPFRLVLNDGRRFDVLGPNRVWPVAKRNYAVIIFPLADDPRLYGRHTTVRLDAIVAVEPLPTPAQAG